MSDEAIDKVIGDRLLRRNEQDNGVYEELALLFQEYLDRVMQNSRDGESVSQSSYAESQVAVSGVFGSGFRLHHVVMEQRNQLDALYSSRKVLLDSLKEEKGKNIRLEGSISNLEVKTNALTSELQQLRIQNQKTEESYLELMARNHDLELRIVEEKSKTAEILNEMNDAMGFGAVDTKSALRFSSQLNSLTSNNTENAEESSSVDDELTNIDLMKPGIPTISLPTSWRIVADTSSTQITSIAYNDDGSILASCSSDGLIQLWSTTTLRKCEGNCTATLKSAVLCVDINASTLLASSERTGYLWSLESSLSNRKINVILTHTLTGHSSTVVTCRLAPDKHRAATGARKIKIWNVATGACELTLDPFSKCFALDFNPSSTTLISGHADKAIRLWELNKGEQLMIFRNLHAGPIVHVLFDRTGDRVVATSMDHTLSLFCISDGSVANRKCFSHAEFRANPYWCKSSISPGCDSNGRMYAGCGSKDGSLHIWDSSSGKSVYRQKVHAAPITCTVWSPRGDELATCDSEGAIILWN